MGKYFSRFQTINYNGYTATNIMQRVDITKLAKDVSSSYYNTTVPNGRRLEDISYDYYGDVEYLFMIYLANGIIDPYYDPYLSTEDLEASLVAQYGSLANAQSTIVYWRQNWDQDDTRITVDYYNGLPENQKRYWQPVVQGLTNISEYIRKRDVDTIHTNATMIATLASENVVSNTVYYGSNWNGFVTNANTANIVFEQIIGDPTQDTNVTVLYVQTNITDDIADYWIPVSVYDDAVANNEIHKEIQLITNGNQQTIEAEFKIALAGN